MRQYVVAAGVVGIALACSFASWYSPAPVQEASPRFPHHSRSIQTVAWNGQGLQALTQARLPVIMYVHVHVHVHVHVCPRARVLRG